MMNRSLVVISLSFVGIVIFFLAGSGLAGCGGGTRGSGGQTFDGFVRDSRGVYAPNIAVTILATGDSTVTDDQGAYHIQSEALSGDIEFLLEGSSFSGRSVATGIPADAKVIVVNFSIGAGPAPSIDSEVHIVERAPTPTRKPISQETRLPAPSAIPTIGPPSAVPKATPSHDDHVGNGGSGSDGKGSGDSSNSGPDNSGTDNSGPDNSGGGQSSRTPTPIPALSPTVNGEHPEEGESVNAEGRITALSGNSVSVNGKSFVASSTSEFRGKDGERLTLGDFFIGENVRARGKIKDGAITLERLEKR